jgi:hypothetical protein
MAWSRVLLGEHAKVTMAMCCELPLFHPQKRSFLHFHAMAPGGMAEAASDSGVCKKDNVVGPQAPISKMLILMSGLLSQQVAGMLGFAFAHPNLHGFQATRRLG